MTNSNTAKVYIVEDRPELIKSMTWTLESVGYEVEAYSNAIDFLKKNKITRGNSCLLLDVRMPQMTGLELKQLLTDKGIEIPVIFITAYADVPMAVRAMKLGAVEFLTKPVREQELIEAVNKALRVDKQLKANKNLEENVLVDTLTNREKEIFRLLVNGKLNKQIAHELNISQKTVELHRANIKRKLHAKTTAELVRIGLQTLANIDIQT